MPTDPSAEAGERPGLKPGRLVLELAGAAAGIVVFVNLVGALVWSARLDALDLPVESTVALLPTQTILLAGARLLLPSVVLAAVMIFWLSLLRARTLEPGWLNWWRRLVLAAPAAVIVVAIARYPRDRAILPDHGRLVILIVLAAIALCVLVAARGPTVKAIGASLFTVIAVFSGWAGYQRATDPPVDLSSAVVHTSDGGRTTGYLLARTADEVILAPDVAGRTIQRVAVLRRGDVVSLRLAPGDPRGARPLGPYRGTVHEAGVPPPPVAGKDDTMARARTYLAAVRNSTLWKYPPVVFGGSIGLWETRYAEFAGYTPREFEAKGVTASLEELNEETIAFDGVVVVTEGVVLVAGGLHRYDDKVTRQFVAIQSLTSKDSRAVCPVARRAGQELHAGQRVRLRALVLAAGIFVSGSGAEGRRVAMVCASAGPGTGR